MKRNYLLIAVIELGLVALMAFCCILAFSHSSPGLWLQEQASSRSAQFGYFLPWIIWLVVFIAGSLLVVLAGSSGKFTWLTVLLALPSLLSFNAINIFKIVRVDLPVETTISFFQAVIIGISLMTGYILLDRFCLFRREMDVLNRRGAGNEDLEKTFGENNLRVWLLSGISVLVVASVAILSTGLSSWLIGPVSGMPWNIILAGIVCILALAFFLYWLGLRRNSG